MTAHQQLRRTSPAKGYVAGIRICAACLDRPEADGSRNSGEHGYDRIADGPDLITFNLPRTWSGIWQWPPRASSPVAPRNCRQLA